MVHSREFIGKIYVCDFCYHSEPINTGHYNGESKTTLVADCHVNYKGFSGLIRWRLRKNFERKNPDLVKKILGDIVLTFKK